jgi:cell division septation protein DedD
VDSIPPDTTAASVSARHGTPTAPAGFAVQVAAVRSVAAADQSMQALKRAGYDPRVTREAGGILKVRVGHFKTRADAQRVASEIRRKLAMTPFVVEEP